MSKVRIHFPRTVEWAGRVIEKGVNEFDTDKESKGFVDRCIKRGCTLLEEGQSEQKPDKVEEPKEEKKKKSKKKPKKEE